MGQWPQNPLPSRGCATPDRATISSATWSVGIGLGYENMDCVLTLPVPNFLVDIIQGLDVMPSQTSSSKGELHISLTYFLLGPKRPSSTQQKLGVYSDEIPNYWPQ